jgi:hypothetical protein
MRNYKEMSPRKDKFSSGMQQSQQYAQPQQHQHNMQKIQMEQMQAQMQAQMYRKSVFESVAPSGHRISARNPFTIGTPIVSYKVQSTPTASAFSDLISPFAQGHSRYCDHENMLPARYSPSIAETNLSRLEAKIQLFTDTTLFYIFYTNVNDPMQLIAAKELYFLPIFLMIYIFPHFSYQREWRWLRSRVFWVKRLDDTLLLFDTIRWEVVPRNDLRTIISDSDYEEIF